MILLFCFAEEANLALLLPVKPSTTWSQAYSPAYLFRAVLAVDGIEDNIFPAPWSCSLTLYSSTPQWFLVDLQQIYFIKKVTLVPREQ